MTEVEQKVVEFLCKNKQAYTKTIYKAVNCKVYGYSLNKFRKLLELMSMQNCIKYKHNGLPHPYWYI